ncbi:MULTISPECIES: DUF4232 domain-containing protein [Streptomyces]|uniref:DUF4232 domain-containing protein n=1 Tax=Streptomyces TaxID=1883 RepID=UPI0002C6CB98|nr:MULTISPECIES: DUF4232 domain-containing protein [Streptomyces]MDF9874261.1 hypothetical protein [Streptomyces pratensis]TPN19861.1 hypothetical protein FKO01_33580 [Mesorhizobium sp. B2-3-3]WSZ46238.1 DUF4232 domain-containing protein [[Kitasatospora] papulosa]AGJ53017.1 hypothetical protein F750_0506 [Streptomyces sp. PAMC 26508]MCY1649819.1 DUF4232 domain-containing protein [Streptomyces sp. SL203]
MRSRSARSARLAVAAAAVAALAATATACGPEDTTDTSSSAASSATTAPSAGEGGDAPSTSGSTASGDKSSGSGSSGPSDKSGSGDKSGYGQSCGTNDLEFTVTAESQAGGYYLVTAKAKSGITCYLDVNTPSVSFGSGADGVASPVGQGGEDPIELTGSAVAYTGINPKTTNTDGGKEFENVIIAVTEDDPDPAELELPDTATVDKPIVTNWSTKRDETVPRIV